MTRQKEILKQAGIYSFGTQLNQFITLFTSILSRRLLGPTQTGIWSILQIVVDYSKYSTLGVMQAVSREIPYWKGKGAAETAEGIKNQAFTFILASSSFIAIGICAFAVIFRHRFSAEIINGLFLVAAIILLQRLNNLLISLLRSDKQFTIEAKQMVTSSIVNAVLVGGLTYFFKIYGFIWSVLLSFAYNIGFILFHYRFHFRLRWDQKQISGLARFGFPLMILSLMMTGLRNMDEIFIGKFLGFKLLGLYSIGPMACAYIGSFSNSVAIVLFPHLQEKFGAHDQPAQLKGFLFKASNAYALTTALLIGLIDVAAPIFIRWLLPRFVPGIPSMKVLVFSMFFISQGQVFNDFLITIKKHLYLFPILISSILVAVILDYAVIHSRWGIQGIAYATTAAALFHFCLLYFVSARFLKDVRLAVKNFFIYVGYCAYIILTLLIIQRVVTWPSRFLIQTILQVIVFLIASSPLMIALFRQYPVASLFQWKSYKKQPATANEAILP